MTPRAVNYNTNWTDKTDCLKAILDKAHPGEWTVYPTYSVQQIGNHSIPVYAINPTRHLVIANWRALWRLGKALSNWGDYVPIILSTSQSINTDHAALYLLNEIAKHGIYQQQRITFIEKRAAATRDQYENSKADGRLRRKLQAEEAKATENIDSYRTGHLKAMLTYQGDFIIRYLASRIRFNVVRKTPAGHVKFAALIPPTTIIVNDQACRVTVGITSTPTDFSLHVPDTDSWPQMALDLIRESVKVQTHSPVATSQP
jgi:hypothetical protein